jgi:hypothetical protein
VSDPDIWSRRYVVGTHGGEVEIRIIPTPKPTFERRVEAAHLAAGDPSELITFVRKLASQGGYTITETKGADMGSSGRANDLHHVWTVELRLGA